MKYIISILIVFIGASCSTKKNNGTESKKTDLDSISVTNVVNDINRFEIKGETFFKQYIDDQGQYITEQQKVTFDYGSDRNRNSVLTVSKLNSIFTGGYEQPDNKLNVKAYTSSESKYDRLLWELNIEDQEPVGIWGKYFKTVFYGCCGAEDGYTLYDLATGMKFLTFSEMKYSVSPYYMNYGYISSNTMGVTNSGDTTSIGQFYHIKENIKTNQDELTVYTTHSKSEDGELSFTPEISLETKRQLKANGFFKSFNLFQKGDTLTRLDTADYYIVLKYYSPNRSILLPLDKNGLRASEFISNDKELSVDFEIKEK